MIKSHAEIKQIEVNLMTAKILDGKALAKKIRDELKAKVDSLGDSRRPGLGTILVGDNPASRIYVEMKEKACRKAGFFTDTRRLPSNVSRETLLETINEFNNDLKIDGILLQLPLPEHLDKNEMDAAILPEKDVDGFHPINQGRLLLDEPGFEPCTPKGIIRLLKENNIEIKGADAVVVGRGFLVGKAVAVLLLRNHATVTICHTRTRNLAEHTKRADILVVAAGVRGLVSADMVKSEAVVVDVGINELPDGSVVGDVDFDKVKEVAGWITPVPGGIGPMTITMLMENTWLSYIKREGIKR